MDAIELGQKGVIQNSDLRFGLDKKSYFYSTTDSEGEMDLTERAPAPKQFKR